MKTYILTDAEVRAWDSGDAQATNGLMADLRMRFGRFAAEVGEVETEVQHPDGYTVSSHTQGLLRA